jgi:PKD repeat protein
MARVMQVSFLLLLLAAVSGCNVKTFRADFVGSPVSGPTPLTVQFTDQSVTQRGKITTWSWQFGDGGTSAEENPSHTYTKNAKYTVRLDIGNGTDTSHRIRIWYIVVAASSEGEGEGEGETEIANLLEVADPLSATNTIYTLPSSAVPRAGQTVSDTNLNTYQRRVTQTLGYRHDFSRHDPFNADQSKILLYDIPNSLFRIYKTTSVPYDASTQFVTALSIDEPRWDRSNANIIWGLIDFKIVTINMSALKITNTVKDFSKDATISPILAANTDLYRISMGDEGDASQNRRYWAFTLDSKTDHLPHYLFCWDHTLDVVSKVLTLTAQQQTHIGWVGMSPLGNWVVIGATSGSDAPIQGLTMADRALENFYPLDYTTSSCDLGTDTGGAEVAVMENVQTGYIDLIPLSKNTKPILTQGGRYTGTNRTPLVRLFYSDTDSHGLNSGVHVSCNTSGWCVVSTYIAPNLTADNWLDRKNILVKLNASNPRAWYLSHIYGVDGSNLDLEQTQAAITVDGTRIVWATNWNQNVGSKKVWDMEIDLPAGWKTVLGQ